MGNSLESQVALVTGASRGIGKAIALDLAKEGAFVYVNYSSNADAANKVVEEIKANGGNAKAIGFKVQDRDAVENAINQIKDEQGKIDILINNAGISRDDLIIRAKDEDWQSTMDVNLTGAFYVSRAVSKVMLKSKYGRIVNISSIVGQMGNIGQSAYSASKAGLIGFSKTLARELASKNITVNVVTPGFIETDMTNELNDKVKESCLNNIPLKRFAKPNEVANAVSFFAKPSAGYITGQVLSVSGGLCI